AAMVRVSTSVGAFTCMPCMRGQHTPLAAIMRVGRLRWPGSRFSRAVAVQMAVQLRHGNGPLSRDTMAERANIASDRLVRTIKENGMDIQELLTHARDTMTVKQVFGEPYEKDGVTVIPVAAVGGGGGGGSGEQKGEGKGG